MKVVMIGRMKRYRLNFFLPYQKNAKEWNLEERQLYDDGDPPQSVNSKVISI
jgi:hypothetical protein